VAPCCTLPFQPGFFVILLSFLLWLIWFFFFPRTRIQPVFFDLFLLL
jgi:hypothetical protein